MAHPTTPAFRKRQFRFSVRNDIDLLKLVVEQNPYGAPHGGRLHKWQAIADTLRDSGIDIDFRRARDRTALLLEQWRQQDINHLKRSSSGNHEDHAQKFQLLDQINTIEHAAKPRDNLVDIRRDRMRHTSIPQQLNHSHLPPDDNHPPTTSLSLQPDRPKYPPFSTTPSPSPPSQPQPLAQQSSHTGHLPPLNHDSVLPQTRPADDVTLPFSSQHPPDKLVKTNSGKRLVPPFSQSLFPHSAPIPLSSADHRSPPRNPEIPYPDLPLFRTHSFRPANPVLTSAPIDVSTVPLATVPLPPSPRLPENPPIQLAVDPNVASNTNANTSTPPGNGPPTAPPLTTATVTDAQLRAHIMKLEQILEQQVKLWKRSIEIEEKRVTMESQRIQKEYAERKEEREERRLREAREREEKDKLFKYFWRHRDIQVDPEHPE